MFLSSLRLERAESKDQVGTYFTHCSATGCTINRGKAPHPSPSCGAPGKIPSAARSGSSTPDETFCAKSWFKTYLSKNTFFCASHFEKVRVHEHRHEEQPRVGPVGRSHAQACLTSPRTANRCPLKRGLHSIIISGEFFMRSLNCLNSEVFFVFLSCQLIQSPRSFMFPCC